MSKMGCWVQLPNGITWQMRYGERVCVQKSEMPYLPADYSESKLSLRCGAKKVFRDQNKQNSLQVREYADHWEFQLDRYNPEMSFAGFVGHALTDAIGVTLLIVLAATATYAVLKNK